MKITIKIIFLFFGLLCSIAKADITNQNNLQYNLQLVASYGKGRLYQVNSFYVSVLHGNYRVMGEQYGALYKKQLQEIYSLISTHFAETSSFAYAQILLKAKAIYDSYPKKYQEIILGMSETSGLDLNKLIIINAEEAIYIGAPQNRWRCSAIAVWGNYTKNNQLIFGRNYDLGPLLNKYVTVVVYKPQDGSIPVASVTYIGAIYVTSGLNKSGIFLELNNGEGSGSAFYVHRPSNLVLLFSFLQKSKTLKQLEVLFHKNKSNSTSIVNVADTKQAYSYEWATFMVQQRKPDDYGLLVATNHFVDKIWKTKLCNIAKTIERRANLLKLAKKYKGEFTPSLMMKIISVPVNEGGAFWPPSKRFYHSTSYQIVAIPSKLTLWIKIPEVITWTKIDLKNLF